MIEESPITVALRERLELTSDEDEKRRIRDTLAEHDGQSLSGAGHNRESGGDDIG